MTNSSLQINDQTYEIDIHKPLSIAIPLNFDGAQPNAYGVEKASSKACEAGEIVGDTRRGGSCNFEQYKLIPHCNGTHTECVGHISHARISVHECLQDAFILANLISVTPEKASESNETYAVELGENDFLITRKAIENSFENFRFDELPTALKFALCPMMKANSPKLTRKKFRHFFRPKRCCF